MKSHTHTHTHIHRIAFYNIMNGSGEHMLSKISQTEKDKHYDFTYMWNLKDTMNKKNSHSILNLWLGVFHLF